MAISFDKALGVHPYALQARVQRSEILANNLANVDTPGFLAKDYDFKTAMASVEADLSTRNPRGHGLPNMNMESLYRVPNQPSKDGNTAELGVEQAKFNSNVMDFQTSLTFLNMKISGLQKVIEGR